MGAEQRGTFLRPCPGRPRKGSNRKETQKVGKRGTQPQPTVGGGKKGKRLGVEGVGEGKKGVRKGLHVKIDETSGEMAR